MVVRLPPPCTRTPALPPNVSWLAVEERDRSPAAPTPCRGCSLWLKNAGVEIPESTGSARTATHVGTPTVAILPGQDDRARQQRRRAVERRREAAGTHSPSRARSRPRPMSAAMTAATAPQTAQARSHCAPGLAKKMLNVDAGAALRRSASRAGPGDPATCPGTRRTARARLLPREALDFPAQAAAASPVDDRARVERAVAGRCGTVTTSVPSSRGVPNTAPSRLHEQRHDRDREQDADERQLERRRRDRGRDDEHDEADLLGLLDRRAEPDDRQRAEQARARAAARTGCRRRSP